MIVGKKAKKVNNDSDIIFDNKPMPGLSGLFTEKQYQNGLSESQFLKEIAQPSISDNVLFLHPHHDNCESCSGALADEGLIPPYKVEIGDKENYKGKPNNTGLYVGAGLAAVVVLGAVIVSVNAQKGTQGALKGGNDSEVKETALADRSDILSDRVVRITKTKRTTTISLKDELTGRPISLQQDEAARFKRADDEVSSNLRAEAAEVMETEI